MATAMHIERISKGLVVDHRRAPRLVVGVRRRWFDLSTVLLAFGAVVLGSMFPAWGIALACLLLVKLGFVAVGRVWSIEMEFDSAVRHFRAERRTPFGRRHFVTVPYAALAFVPVNGTRPRWAIKAGEHHIRLGQREDARALIAAAGLQGVVGADQFERASKPAKASH